jgi:general secretion pathway protein D
MIPRALPAIAAAGLAFAGPTLAMVQTSPPAGDHVTATIIPGQAPYPTTAQAQAAIHPGARPGDVSLNFPAADVHDVAQAVLGDLLHVRYTVDPAATGAVTLVTAQPIARDEVLGALEDALAAAKLALVRRGGAYAVIPLAQARAEAPAPEGDAPGFATETVQLRFIAGAELKKLLDPVAPDTIAVSDPARNIVTLSGPQGRRRAARALIEQFDVDWLRGMSFGLFVPKNTDSRLLVPEIEKLLNGEGSPSAGLVRLIAMDKINGVLAVSAQPQYLEDVRRWIEVLDREGETSERRLFVYRVEYGKASDLARAINAVFGVAGGAAQAAAQAAAPAQIANGFDLQTPPPPATSAAAAAQRPVQSAPGRTGEGLGGATVTSDETNNAVLVLGAPREYAVVEDALRKLDVAPVQVLIEAAIAEVTLNHNLQYGIQWNFQTGHNQFNLLPNTGTVTSPSTSITPSTTTVATALTQAGQSLPGFNYLYANTGTITATLNALSGMTTVNVLSAPKMMVLNNHTASLEVGDQVPVVTASAVSTVGSNAPLVNSVDYRDTGVILKVTPRVNSGGMVLLDIAQEVSDVTTTSTSNINSPTIEQRKFATSIAVQDGQTIALGGLIKDTRTKGRSGLPVLSAIPILGALAGTRTDSDVRTELLILLTPRVVRSAPDAEAITEDLRKKIQALEPLPPVKSFRP